jgi:transposase
MGKPLEKEESNSVVLENSKLSVDQEQLARRLVLVGKSASDIARTFNVHEAMIYRLAQM